MKQCQHCGQDFTPIRCNQKYCTCRSCQKSRKRKWQKEKLERDPDYNANQRDAQKRWCEKNKDYWQKYRSTHPGYKTSNLQLQRMRNTRRSGKMPQDGVGNIAKMDSKVAELSGTYYIFPVTSCTELPELIAKMDAKLVTIQSVTGIGAKKM